MKILFITSLLGKQYGGAEVSTRLLLEKLVEQGHDVQALTTRKIKNDNRLMSISFPIEVPKKLLTLGNTVIDYFLARKIKEKLKEIKPDILHIQDTYILPATVAANKTLKIPAVATIRNSVLDETWELMFPKPISTMLKKRNKTIIKALHNIDCVISVSKYIKTELVQRGINRGKIIPIYNLPPTFKETDGFSSKKEDSNIHLFAPGFLASFKGFSVLIKAMKTVVEKNSNVDLTIAGDGPEKKKLEKMTKKLKLDSCIKFAGKIPFADLHKQYRDCDIVIFPSIYAEPFGRVALEAMYFRKPVIASKVGGIPEVILNNQTGLLVNAGCPEELAHKINFLIENRTLREEMGENGKFLIEKFNEIKIVNSHLDLYRSLIRNN